MASDVTPIYTWMRAVLLAHDGVVAIVGTRVFQAFPAKGRAYPGIALHDSTDDYDSFAQGGTTFHDLLVPAEIAGTNPDELRALEAAFVSAFEPDHFTTIDPPAGFTLHAVEIDTPSPPREDIDHEPPLHRRIVPVAITALPA